MLSVANKIDSAFQIVLFLIFRIGLLDYQAVEIFVDLYQSLGRRKKYICFNELWNDLI